VQQRIADSRKEGAALGQAMIDAGLFHHVVDDHEFEDKYLFFRFFVDETVKEKQSLFQRRRHRDEANKGAAAVTPGVLTLPDGRPMPQGAAKDKCLVEQLQNEYGGKDHRGGGSGHVHHSHQSGHSSGSGSMPHGRADAGAGTHPAAGSHGSEESDYAAAESGLAAVTLQAIEDEDDEEALGATAVAAAAAAGRPHHHHHATHGGTPHHLDKKSCSSSSPGGIAACPRAAEEALGGGGGGGGRGGSSS